MLIFRKKNSDIIKIKRALVLKTTQIIDKRCYTYSLMNKFTDLHIYTTNSIYLINMTNSWKISMHLYFICNFGTCHSWYNSFCVYLQFLICFSFTKLFAYSIWFHLIAMTEISKVTPQQQHVTNLTEDYHWCY